MTTKLIKAKGEAADSSATPKGGVKATPLDNIGRLRIHLKADSLALTLLNAWTGIEPPIAKARLLKAVDGHFSEKK
jgi:hypothetical protein